MRSPGNGTAPSELLHGLDTQVLARVTPTAALPEGARRCHGFESHRAKLAGTFGYRLKIKKKKILSEVISQPLSPELWVGIFGLCSR